MDTRILSVAFGTLISSLSFGAGDNEAEPPYIYPNHVVHQFTWTAMSTSDRLYVCNTGIGHSGGSTDDKIEVTYYPMDEYFNPGDAQTATLKSAKELKALKGVVDSLGTMITQLKITLSSEKYGAKYFIDVCYRGPEYDAGKYNIKERFSLSKNSLTYSDHRAADPEERHYFSLANVSATSYTVCDTQGRGTHQGPPSGATTDIASVSKKIGDRVINRNVIPLSRATQTLDFGQGGSSGADLLNGSPDSGGKNTAVPRNCITRYEVWESNNDVTRSEKIAGGDFTAETKVKNDR